MLAIYAGPVLSENAPRSRVSFFGCIIFETVDLTTKRTETDSTVGYDTKRATRELEPFVLQSPSRHKQVQYTSKAFLSCSKCFFLHIKASCVIEGLCHLSLELCFHKWYPSQGDLSVTCSFWKARITQPVDHSGAQNKPPTPKFQQHRQHWLIRALEARKRTFNGHNNFIEPSYLTPPWEVMPLR